MKQTGSRFTDSIWGRIFALLMMALLVVSLMFPAEAGAEAGKETSAAEKAGGGAAVEIDNETAAKAGSEAEAEPAWKAYNGKRLGVLTGTPMEDAAREFFPDSEYFYFNSYPDCNAALLAGKIDAYLGDEPGVKTIRAEQPKIDYIKERLTNQDYSFAFRKNDPESAALCEELNEFLKKIRADGTFQEIEDIWMGVDEDKKVVDMSDLTGENGTIKVITTSTDMPWSYIKDGKHVGYDIDLVVRFCRDRGYALKLGDVDFSGRIPAIQSGKYDFTTDMNVTPEREEEVLFSDPTSTGGIVLAVPAEGLPQGEAGSAQTTEQKGDTQGGSAEEAAAGSQGDAAQGAEPELTTFDDLNGKVVSLLTGAPFEDMIREKSPGVAEFVYYNTVADQIISLQSGKSDALFTNNAVGALAVNRNPDLTYFPESLQESAFGIAFPKGSAERAVWQEAYDRIPQDEIQAIFEKWSGADESAKVLPEQDWPGNNGTAHVAVCDSLEPLSYVGGDDEPMGFDVEVILRVAKELDMHVELTPMEFSALLTYVQSGKCDLACGSIVVTEERAQAVDFIEYYPAKFMLLVRAKGGAQNQSFFAAVRESFTKTFVREGRWKLFLQGIGTTLLITVLSVILGTLLGFFVFMACRRGNRIANGIAKVAIWLVQGMPVVVLLMILYYIIFGNVDINGTLVSIIAFTLVFGSAMYGMLKTGVAAVDGGQMEAALALGYEDRKAFKRLVLPQALRHIMPIYRGEITSLIKATAIVGYIAVQDLTRMGDLVRSRTYDAFFPLIAVAIVYFILAGLLTAIVRRIGARTESEHRSREEILKGIEV